MIIAARASSTPPLLLSVLLLPVHIVLAVVLSLGLLSFRGRTETLLYQLRFSCIHARTGFGVFGLLYAIAATRFLAILTAVSFQLPL